MTEKFVQHIINGLDYASYSPNTAAFDIGSAEGMYVKPLRKKFDHVYAFDADRLKDVFYVFTGMEGIHPVKKAVADHTGTVKLYISNLNIGRHSINEDHVKHFGTSWGYDLNRYDEVECITIDDFCEKNNIKHVGFIKCDIEAGEASIFKGAVKTLKENEMDLVVELHDGVDLQKLEEFFREQGYKMHPEAEYNVNFPFDNMIHYLFSNRKERNE